MDYKVVLLISMWSITILMASQKNNQENIQDSKHSPVCFKRFRLKIFSPVVQECDNDSVNDIGLIDDVRTESSSEVENSIVHKLSSEKSWEPATSFVLFEKIDDQFENEIREIFPVEEHASMSSLPDEQKSDLFLSRSNIPFQVQPIKQKRIENFARQDQITPVLVSVKPQEEEKHVQVSCWQHLLSCLKCLCCNCLSQSSSHAVARKIICKNDFANQQADNDAGEKSLSVDNSLKTPVSPEQRGKMKLFYDRSSPFPSPRFRKKHMVTLEEQSGQKLEQLGESGMSPVVDITLSSQVSNQFSMVEQQPIVPIPMSPLVLLWVQEQRERVLKRLQTKK